MSGGTKDTRVTKSNNRRVVVTLAARSVFILLNQRFDHLDATISEAHTLCESSRDGA